jgi:hypothetical protein
MIEPKLNLELSNVFLRLKFLAGCGQFSDIFSNSIDMSVWSILRTLPEQLQPYKYL